ncbi:DNA-binding protein snt1 [Coemansia sp. RSA 2336]|nr:DNA-binding protein snt1 [Coemansia sp. RSA 2336]
MSYYRPPPDSQNSSGGREWEYQRDRQSGRPAHGHGDMGVVRDRRRAMSNDRDGHNFPRPAGSDMRSRSRHDRRPYDGRHRGGSASGEAERGREWARRDRDHLGLPRRSSNREPLYREGNVPPPLFSRHTAGAFIRGRGTPPHMAAAAAATPHFSRRATEPGESLEEGELEMDSRSGPPHRRGIGSRMHTSPADAGAHIRRNDAFSSTLRTDRRSPLPASPMHSSAYHSRPASRKPSHTSFKPEMQHASRKPTPSSMHLPQSPVEIVRTPSPVLPPRSPATGSVAGGSKAFKAESRENTAPRDGSRTPSPRSITPEPDVPKQQLQSRISDIDREIAECKEKLDQISGSRLLEDKGQTSLQAQAQSSLPKPQRTAAESSDHMVPTSPPVKSTLPLSASSDAVSIVRSETPAIEALPIATADVKAAVAAEIAAPVVPQATGEHSSDAADMDVDLLLSDSASEGEGSGKGKDKLLGLVNSIYAENQKKAAEIQARLAAPFLEAYSKLIPGQYPSPTDWPFWAENEKRHERMKPHLVRILGQEKRQEQTHARQLQTEYSTLYAKWRKRVDKLDRQREAKQRSNSISAGSSNQSTFGATTHRRRGGVVPSNTTDEFGFSLGPLFSASVSASHHIDSGGRLDDSLFTSDAVHSEAELQAIIERLQHDDARNPDLRSQRTAATIPDMVLDPKERAMLRFNNNSHKIADPISFYHVRMPQPGSSDYRRVAYGNNADSNHYWTQNEVSAFIAAYLTYPKEFGKIAAHIPHKSMNECVLFYYRNKKQLKLKELEAKSVKRARRSRQAASGSSGRRRKERARERRERRAREERERMAMEVAAECAPTELDAGIDETSAQAQTSAMVSDDDGAASASGANSTGDILERRSKGSALLRSIIAANRQRKREALMDGSSLPSLDENVTGTDKLPALVSPSIEAAPLPADEDEDLEEDADGTASPTKSLPGLSRSNTLQPPDKRRQQSGEPSGTTPSLPSGAPLSSSGTRVRREEATGSSSNRPASDEEEDDEEEGELVEDTRWEPRRRSRQTSELNAYAMGGSIVRTRRTRELEQANGAYASDSESDSAQAGRRGRRRSSLVSAYGEDEEEIVEISGVVADRGQAALQERSRPRIVSRRSQSRFGAMLTAVLEPEDAANADAADDAEGALVLTRQRSITPQSAGEWPARAQAGSPPQESALDRFVAAEPEALQRPISSHETLMMCLSATNSLTSPVAGLSGQQGQQSASGPTQSVHQQQLEAQVNAEAGTQDTVLVGAAVWVRDDRRRVLRGFHKLGADFAQVASLMPSKTTAQCRYFYYHYRTPAGTLISEIIGNGMQSGLPAMPASAKASSDSRQPNVDSLVLPPVSRSQSSAAGFTLPAQDRSQTGDQGRSGSKLQPVESSSSEDDDEMPLATQLAEELAALERSHPTTPVLPGGSQRGSEIPQVRPEQLNPRVTPIASLVLPPKPASDQPLSAGGPLSATPSAMNNVSGRTSPHSPVPGAATAKKSGYSSYWSVHERSAFMHYVVRLGQNWQHLAEAIGSKTGTQVRNYFRANREKLGLDAIIVEYERNRAAGTLPPMVPFQPPAPSTSTASSANAAGGAAAKDDGGVRKEKRGRKRKTDLAAATAAAVAAKSPRAETIEHDSVPLAQGAGASSAAVSGAVPAKMANFPTMGIDGGRAVVYTRPPPAAAAVVQQRAQQSHSQQSHGQQMWAQQSQASARHSLPPPYVGQTHQRPPPASYQYSLPHIAGNAEMAEQQQRIGSVARDDSNTPLSQPTPPPVEGLPRFSSSPAPPAVAVSQQQPAAHRGSLSALHISNLTESSSSNLRISGNRRQGQQQQQAASVMEAEEPRKVSVTKINALLNDEPTETKPEDWFANEPQQQQRQQSSQEDDATGIAALALASMMGSRASPRVEQPQQQQQRHRLAYPQPRASTMHRPSDPLPPIAASQPLRGTGSAFSPVSPSGQLRSLSRPSSVDPTNAYSHNVRVLSPVPMATGSSSHHPQQQQQQQQNMRQRKPSAPPLPHPSAAPFTARSASVYAGYPPPPVQARHVQYAHDPSSQPGYSEPPHRYEQPPRAYPPNQQLQPPAGHYYPMSPQQQQQQQQQQSTGANNPPIYPAYRQQPPYHHHPPM